MPRIFGKAGQAGRKHLRSLAMVVCTVLTVLMLGHNALAANLDLWGVGAQTTVLTCANTQCSSAGSPVFSGPSNGRPADSLWSEWIKHRVDPHRG